MNENEKDDIIKSLGENVKAMRKHRRLTIEELAIDANIGVQTLKQIEKCNSDCQISTLVKISRALGTSIEHLIGNNKHNSPESILHLLSLLTDEKRDYIELMIYHIKDKDFH